MFKILSAIVLVFTTSFYSLQFQDVDGASVSMSSFQGKKVLLVNIATGSSRVSQLQGLQQLQQTYGDSLVIIAFPSNSFGTEPRNNAEIKQFCQSNYNTTFRVASKSQVTGAGINSVYDWLSKKAENGDVDITIGGDFQKVLIAKDGTIQGIYSSKMEPTHPEIIQGITTSY